MDYHMMEKSDISDEVWECARVKVTEEDEDGVAEEETASFFPNGCYLGSHIFYKASRLESEI